MSTKTSVRPHPRSSFSPEEDSLLVDLVAQFGEENWNIISALMKTRNPRQCKDRYLSYLSPNIKNGPFSEDEDELLREKYLEFGPKWVKISKFFTNRTDISIKCRWAVLNRRDNKLKDMNESQELKSNKERIASPPQCNELSISSVSGSNGMNFTNENLIEIDTFISNMNKLNQPIENKRHNNIQQKKQKQQQRYRQRRAITKVALASEDIATHRSPLLTPSNTAVSSPVSTSFPIPISESLTKAAIATVEAFKFPVVETANTNNSEQDDDSDEVDIIDQVFPSNEQIDAMTWEGFWNFPLNSFKNDQPMPWFFNLTDI